MTDTAERGEGPDAGSVEAPHTEIHQPTKTSTESDNRSQDQSTGADEIARSFEADGLELGDRIPLCFQRPGVPFDFRLMTAADAPNFVANLGSDCHVWANANPLRDGDLGPDNRGGVDDIVALRSMPADLDFKRLRADAESDEVALERAEQIIDGISDALGVAPSKVTRTGGGLQPRWGLDSEDEDARFEAGSPQAERAKIAYKRFGNLASIVAREVWPDAKVDNVFDIAHIFRVPGTFNVKAEYGTPRRVTAYYPGGAALSLDELEDRLDARGVPQEELATAPRPQETYNGPAHADMPATVRRRVDLYVDTVFERIASEMAAAADLGEGQPDSQDRTWQRIVADAGFDGGALATDWTGLTEGDVLRRLAAIVPEEMKGAIFSGGRTVSQTLNNHVGRKAKAAPPEWLAGALADAAAQPSGKASAAVVRDPFKPSTNVAPIDRMKGRLWKDSHVALAFSEHYADQVLNVHGLGWLKYDEQLGYFDEVPDSVILGLSDDFARELAVGAARTGDADLAKYAAARLDAPKIKNVVTLAASNHELIAEQLVNLDADSLLLNTPSGVVDLATGELLPHSPDYRMTKVTTDPYRPGATHPDLDQALEALPGQEERDYLQERCGQALLGRQPKEDDLVVLFGGGSNSKTTIIGALSRAVGDYAVGVSSRVVTAGLEREHTTELVDFRGARLAVLEEFPDGGHLSEERLKNLVGTPTMKGRRMQRDNIQWKTTHSMFITMNVPPTISGTSHGVWRRLKVLTFPLRYVATEAEIISPSHRLGDLGLKPRMQGLDLPEGAPCPQREAILAWAIEGARRYLARGDQPTPVPATVQATSDEWRYTVDVLGAFLKENVEVAEGWCIPSTNLLDEYNHYLLEHGRKKVNDKTLASRVAEHPAISHPSIEVTKERTTLAEGADHSPSHYRVSHRSQAVHRAYADGQKLAAWRNLRWAQEGGD